MAHAVRFHKGGGPEVLRYESVEVGEPGPGQVRLRHVAVGLNYADTYFRNGTYPIPLPALNRRWQGMFQPRPGPCPRSPAARRR